jgi:hypothetical protein
MVAVARSCGYRDASGAQQLVKRLEAAAASDGDLQQRLAALSAASRVRS